MILAIAKQDRPLRARFRGLLAQGACIVVPVAVVAETCRGRGPQDARINFIIGKSLVPPADEATGRLAGSLMAAIGSAQTVDAMVVAQMAAFLSSILMTSDPDDIAPLATAAGVTVEVV